jgi:hypothetical protein
VGQTDDQIVSQEFAHVIFFDPGLFQDLDERPDRQILPVYRDDRTPFCLRVKKDMVASFCPVKDKTPALQNFDNLLGGQFWEFRLVPLP